MKLQTVDPQYAAQSWPLVEDHLKRGLAFSGDDFTLEQVKLYVNTGQWLLIGVVDEGVVKGALTISFMNQPNHRVAFNCS
jgi:hypothetical protein